MTVPEASPKEQGEMAEVANVPKPGSTPSRLRWRSCGGCLSLVILFFILFFILFYIFIFQPARESGYQVGCVSRLKQIGIALHNYCDIQGAFPPAYTVDKSGKPLHSWRTLILPYLERQDIYDQLRLDEPWNSEHNLKLLQKCDPYVYHCPRSEAPKCYTNYVMVVGPEFATDGPTPFHFDDFKNQDGSKNSSNVVLIVETTQPIFWFEPTDLRADQISYKINDGTSPGISSNHLGRVYAGFADASVHPLKNGTDPQLVQELLRRKKKNQERIIEFFRD